MKTNANQFTQEVPLPSNYGAAELIVMIRRNTVKSFFIALLAILCVLSAIFIYNKAEFDSELVKETFSNIPTAILNIAKEMNMPEDQPVIIPKSMANNSGERSNSKSVSNSTGSASGIGSGSSLAQQNSGLASENIAGNSGGAGNGIGNNKKNKPGINASALTLSSIVPQEVSGVFYDPNKIVPVDKEPYVDYERFKRCIVYPNDAIRSDIKGEVILKVLIDEYGNTLLIKFSYYRNEVLARAVQDAVKKYGKFEPARQNGKAIKYWITIPIDFRLVD